MPSLIHCVLALPNAEGTEQLQKLRSILCDAGIDKSCVIWPPHITLGIYEGMDEAQLCQHTQQFVESQKPVPVRFGALGIFGTQVLYALPAPSQAYMEFSRQFREPIDQYHGKMGHLYSLEYQYAIPHSTLTYLEKPNKAELLHALDVAMDAFKPFDTMIDAVAIYRYPFEPVRHWSLTEPQRV